MSKRSVLSISTNQPAVSQAAEQVFNLLFGVVYPTQLEENVLANASAFEQFQLYLKAKAVGKGDAMKRALKVSTIRGAITMHYGDNIDFAVEITRPLDDLIVAAARELLETNKEVEITSSLADYIKRLYGPLEERKAGITLSNPYAEMHQMYFEVREEGMYENVYLTGLVWNTGVAWPMTENDYEEFLANQDDGSAEDDVYHEEYYE